MKTHKKKKKIHKEERDLKCPWINAFQLLNEYLKKLTSFLFLFFLSLMNSF